ncbi:ferrous iron transport protein B [Roseivirga sp. BDSF3-8]|uniref:ferrous iron transport protein B n=1 Tax=Roseivirga sp. BDSF3-8 TaxID=3241598 RepID=UPI00353186CF
MKETIAEKGERKLKVALIGNPNSGKSSLFNHLTGLNQKVGNFPGVTVDKKTGSLRLDAQTKAEIIDLPGTYSIYPRSADERVVFEVLSGSDATVKPDIAVVVADVTNLRRNMLLFSQIYDLGVPVVLVLNMVDIAEDLGIFVNEAYLGKMLGIPVLKMNARKGTGIDKLKHLLTTEIPSPSRLFWVPNGTSSPVLEKINEACGLENPYQGYQMAMQAEQNTWIDPDLRSRILGWNDLYGFNKKEAQAQETTQRYAKINNMLKEAVRWPEEKEEKPSFSDKLDKVLTHKIFGYLIFTVVLFLIFQAIFAWATIPMDFIDLIFSEGSGLVKQYFPAGPLTDLLAEGIIPGIGGIVIFIPQIALLFAFIALLEESGYMARVVFLMDKIMRKFGLNGRSVVPMLSGVACAVPAIMAARTIESTRDRLITIFVTPFMTCSARLPVYAILIALVVPDTTYFGVLNLQGIVLLGLYMLGVVGALITAVLMKWVMKHEATGFLIMELPSYRSPRWKNVGFTILNRVKTFVFEAGKIIFAISIVLWVLASYGPAEEMARAEEVVRSEAPAGLSENEIDVRIASYKLEHSFAGKFGHFIEPVIRPLGYDWKIGIALVTSFAAREVFVGTMATIYSIGEDFEDATTIQDRLRSEINPRTGGPMYTPAVAFSLLVFYAFAMQCMSTFAIVKRETKSWKWPIIQTGYMTLMAYVGALITYQLMS